MEPFGLLNLLKTLLPAEPMETPKREEMPTDKEEPTAEKAKDLEEKENACAAFLEAHERRKRKK